MFIPRISFVALLQNAYNSLIWLKAIDFLIKIITCDSFLILSTCQPSSSSPG